MHYTYVLISATNHKFCIGATGNLRQRLKLHAEGRVRSTAYRRPMTLIHSEGCLNADDAYRRERYLKSGRGGLYLKTRLASSLASIREDKLERH